MLAHTQELAARGFEVTLVTPDFDSSLEPHMEVPGVEHVTLRTQPLPIYEKVACPEVSWRNLARLVEVLRRVKPDVLHATQCTSLPLVSFACLLTGTPLVTS